MTQKDYRQLADRVLGMLQQADGNDPSRGHLTMNNWEWPTGVALYGIYKTYRQSGDKSILDYLTGWYDDMLYQPAPNVQLKFTVRNRRSPWGFRHFAITQQRFITGAQQGFTFSRE